MQSILILDNSYIHNIGGAIFCIVFFLIFSYGLYDFTIRAWRLSHEGTLTKATVLKATYKNRIGPKGLPLMRWEHEVTYKGFHATAQSLPGTLQPGMTFDVVYCVRFPECWAAFSGQSTIWDYLSDDWLIILFIPPMFAFGGGFLLYIRRLFLSEPWVRSRNRSSKL